MVKTELETARIYDELEDGAGDGSGRGGAFRVLVDRLWPRGVSRDRAALDLWPKEVAPSTALRERWHGDPRGHEPARFAAFEEAYREELAEDPARSALAELARAVAGKPRVLLLTATKDPSVSHVPVIRAALAEALAKL